MLIPMPGLIADDVSSASDRDPATSHEHAPIGDRPTRDPSNAEVDDPVTVYARQLWTQLDLAATYLRDHIARGDESGSALATDAQWDEWRETYARLLSILAGPAGDGGYGRQEATLEYQNGRASAPAESGRDLLQH
jgi:hypothetical protein